MRRVRKNDDFHRFCEHVYFFWQKRGVMSKAPKLLQKIRWQMKHNRGKIDSKEHCLYELQTGILKFCIVVESFQHAWESKELDALCQNLFEYVENTLEKTNWDFHIEVLKSEIDTTIICVEKNKGTSVSFFLRLRF